jgi:hypothetical protein
MIRSQIPHFRSTASSCGKHCGSINDSKECFNFGSTSIMSQAAAGSQGAWCR